MENISKEYTKLRRDPDVYTDTSADYSLPDYNGDIKKILYTAAAVLPASKFNDGDSISASGIVTYDVIYLNSENKIDHISFNSDYDISAKLRGENLLGSDIETRVSGFSHRLFGPRRINMKAALVSELRVIESMPLNTEGGLEENSDAECVVKRYDVATAAFARSAEREYAEEITSLDGVMADEVEVVYANAACAFDSVATEGGGVNLKGAYTVSMLVKCGDSAPILYKKRIPFDEFVESDDVKEEMSAVAYANVNSVSCSVAEADSGVSLTASIIAEYGVRAYGNRSVSLVKDAYLKSVACENSYEDFTYSTHLFADTKLRSASYSLPISDICDSFVRNVVFMSATSRINDVELSDGCVCVGAEMKLQGVCADVDENGDENCFSVKFSFQIAEKVNVGCQIPDGSSAECKIHVVDAVATLDDENMYVDVSYMLDCVLEGASADVRLAACVAKEGETFEKRGSEIVVYYPTDEDTLFSVAKAFHTSPKALAQDNMLSQSVMNSFDEAGALHGVKKLIIK